MTTFAVASLFAALVALTLRVAWDPPGRTYLEYVPIGAVFAALVWDRLIPSWPGHVRATLCDVLAVGLALMRVFIPPLPFVSGHTLLAAYAVLTSRHWPLRTIAVGVLVQVVYTKVFGSTGWKSMLGGLLLAAILAAVRHRFDESVFAGRSERDLTSPAPKEPPRTASSG